MRYRLVCVALLALTAGCALGGSTADAPETAAASPTPTDCSPDLLISDDGNEQVTPRPLPSKPADASAQTAGEFARTYERAFAHNHELGSDVRGVDVTLQGASVRAAGDGYRVRIHVWLRTSVGTERTRTEDDYYDAHYYVSERALRRAETERHGSLPTDTLRKGGLTLACWG